MLSGKKTYITAVIYGLVSAGEYLGLIPAPVATAIKGALIAGAFSFLRMAVAKTEDKS